MEKQTEQQTEKQVLRWGPFATDRFNFDEFDVPQGSLDEAFLINSPENTREDVFLSKFSYDGLLPCSIADLEAKLAQDEPKPIPDWEETVTLAKFEELESQEPDRPLSVVLKEMQTAKASEEKAEEQDKFSMQRIDQYGFFLEEGTDPIAMQMGKQKSKDQLKPAKILQLLNQWDTLSEDKKKKIKAKAKRGIPNELRGGLWMKFADVDSIHEESVAKYQARLSESSPFDEQIHRDLNRSLPKHVFFQDSGGAGQLALFNILKSYALNDPKVGYCQGMGFITAVFLLYVPSEDAYCLTQRVIQDYDMSGLFEPGFPTLFQCFNTHQQLFQLWLPRLAAHFGVEPNMYAFGWYTTIFVNSLRFPYIIRILDMFFCDGMKVLYRIAVAILKTMQKALLAAEFDQIVMMLNNLDKELVATPDEVVTIAMEFTLSSKRLDKIQKEYEASGGR